MVLARRRSYAVPGRHGVASIDQRNGIQLNVEVEALHNSSDLSLECVALVHLAPMAAGLRGVGPHVSVLSQQRIKDDEERLPFSTGQI